MENETRLFMHDGYTAFTGEVRVPDRACVALEVARVAAFGIDKSYALGRWGLPNGEETQPNDEIDTFFEDALAAGCLAFDAGLLDDSPDFAFLGENHTPTEHAGVVLAEIINRRLRESRAMPFLLNKGEKFEAMVMTPRSLSGWVWSGFHEIASRNGSLVLGVCRFRACQRVYKKNTKRSEFCCPSHRVRESLARDKEVAEADEDIFRNR